MTQEEIFIAECQATAERGIARMESEMLSSFYAILQKPAAAFSEYDFTVPDLPVIPEFTANATYQPYAFSPNVDHVWAAEEMDDLQLAIFTALSNGGIGISQELQDAIFNSDRERKLQTLDDSLLRVNAGMGARGFRLPNDMLAAQRNELIQKYQFDAENLSREVTKLIEEHARQNWQFCIQNGITTEQFHADFANKYDQMFIEMKRAAVEQFRIEVQAEVEAYRAQIDGIISRLDAYKTRIDASTAGMSAQIEKAKYELDANYKSAVVTIDSQKTNVSKSVAAYAAYADLVKSFAATASGSSIRINK